MNHISDETIAALEAGRTPPPGYTSVMAWLRDYHLWLKSKGLGSIAMLADYLGLSRQAVYAWLVEVPQALPNNGRIAQLLQFREAWESTGRIPEPPLDDITVAISLSHRDRLKELAEESNLSPEEWTQHAVNYAVDMGLVFGTRVVVEARKGRR